MFAVCGYKRSLLHWFFREACLAISTDFAPVEFQVQLTLSCQARIQDSDQTRAGEGFLLELFWENKWRDASFKERSPLKFRSSQIAELFLFQISSSVPPRCTFLRMIYDPLNRLHQRISIMKALPL